MIFIEIIAFFVAAVWLVEMLWLLWFIVKEDYRAEIHPRSPVRFILGYFRKPAVRNGVNQNTAPPSSSHSTARAKLYRIIR